MIRRSRLQLPMLRKNGPIPLDDGDQLLTSLSSSLVKDAEFFE